MKRGAVVLFRKSTFYPEPVICGVFPYDISSEEAHGRIDAWKADFLRQFPEFKDVELIYEYTDIL